jgi:gamma-glutamylcyclotransferase (GGCT)/AIG2-like uncharacterized protein YtfP
MLLLVLQEVWGVVWELDREHLHTLDRQEGVPRVYNRTKVQVLYCSVISSNS